MLNAGFGRSVLGKSVPEVLSQGPTVHKTENTVFPMWTDQGRQITCLVFFVYRVALKATFLQNFNLSHSVQIWSTRAFHISTQKDVGIHS